MKDGLVDHQARLAAHIDSRGYLVFATADLQAVEKNIPKFAHVYIDSKTQTLAIKFVATERLGVFTLLDQTEHILLFVKGALTRLGLAEQVGEIQLQARDGYWWWPSPQPERIANLKNFACRASRNKPILSINKRGTLVLNKYCVVQLNTPVNNTVNAHFDAVEQKFHLEFSAGTGYLGVRTISSHAEVSLMGTLSSLGLPLPERTYRLDGVIDGNKLVISVVNWFKN